MVVSVEAKREWLRRGISVNRELQILKETRDRVFNDATHITTHYGAGRGSGSMEAHRFDKLAEVDSFIKEKERELVELRSELLQAIYTVPFLEGREVLICRYIHALNPIDIAEKLSYSDRHIKRVHAKALEAIQIPMQKGA